MIAVIFGTTGELIKIAPLLSSLSARGEPFLLVTTGQQVEQIPPLLGDFGLRQPDLWLGRGNIGQDLERPSNIPRWLATVTWRYARRRRKLARRLRDAPTRPLVLVHGDTMTTVLGAAMGRLMRVPVAHVEAGLRSGDWRNPFPEELDRRAASRLATIHYAPGEWAIGNLRRRRVSGEVVDTGANTIRDTLELARDQSIDALPLPAEPFGLVSLHRFELLGNHARLREILKLLAETATRTPLVFIDHPVTIAAVTAAGLDHLFGPRFQRIARLRYLPFVTLMRRSSFMVTDSGGSQEECAYLGLPCLVHRAVTERRDGLDGGSVLISGLDLGQVRAFLADPSAWKREGLGRGTSPTAVIVEHLEASGVIGPG